MATNWTVIDALVHDLGAVRAVADQIDAYPRLADDAIAHELHACLARAADTVHLVIGGDGAMLSQARRCIAEAQQVGDRARMAVERARLTHEDARAIRADSRARTQQTRDHIADLNDLRQASEARRSAPPRRRA